jgi:hypothetical protein
MPEADTKLKRAKAALSVKALALLRRAGDRAERAEYAAVAVLGAQPRTAFPTVIKKSAGIDRHVFALREAAMRTGDDRMKNDVIHDFKAAGSTARSEDRMSQLPGAALNFRHSLTNLQLQ